MNEINECIRKLPTSRKKRKQLFPEKKEKKPTKSKEKGPVAELPYDKGGPSPPKLKEKCFIL